jgi:nucleoside-diphosphate-sugar epimerase
MQRVSIIGCGYTGIRLATRWRDAGATVQGFATRPDSLRAIASAGARPVPLHLDQGGEPGAAVPIELDGHLVYYSVPPAHGAPSDSRLERFLEMIRGTPQRLVYLSTTGVYGDHAGGRVDENTVPTPQSARAVRRVAAEAAIRSWADAHSVSWCILRVAGIYGPGRLPIERLRRGEPAILPQEATPTNRIHVDDLATACVAAGVAARADRRIYNVTDGSEDSLTAYLQRVARLANLPAPPLVTREHARRTYTESSWSFLAESRRVDNRRMLGELGFELAYRDLDDGIRASLKEQSREAGETA